MDSKIESEINNFIKYIRRMSSITDDKQLELLLTVMYNRNNDTYTSMGVDLPGHVQFIRDMSRYSDDKLKSIIKKQYEWDFALQNLLEDTSKRRAIKEMTDAAKDYKADPRKFARQIDKEFRR